MEEKFSNREILEAVNLSITLDIIIRVSKIRRSKNQTIDICRYSNLVSDKCECEQYIFLIAFHQSIRK